MIQHKHRPQDFKQSPRKTRPPMRSRQTNKAISKPKVKVKVKAKIRVKAKAKVKVKVKARHQDNSSDPMHRRKALEFSCSGQGQVDSSKLWLGTWPNDRMAYSRSLDRMVKGSSRTNKDSKTKYRDSRTTYLRSRINQHSKTSKLNPINRPRESTSNSSRNKSTI